MPRIILISGFGGSGKTTCAQLLFDQLENAAIVEADHLFRIKPFDLKSVEGRNRVGRLKLKNSLNVTGSYVDEKFENVIVEGLVWSHFELGEVEKLAKRHHYETWCFWLKADRQVRHDRVIERARDEYDSQEFLDHVEQMIKDPTPLSLPEGRYHEIDTSHRSSGDVVKEMFMLLG